jgi:hypothetical protein
MPSESVFSDRLSERRRLCGKSDRSVRNCGVAKLAMKQKAVKIALYS